MVDPALAQRLTQTFNLVAPRGDDLVDVFYRKIFERHPETRSLFPEDLIDQKRKLLAALKMVITSLDSMDKIIEPLKEMGRRHAGYGVAPEHYPVVRDVLVETIGEFAGDAWTEQYQQDWAAAIDLVASVMLSGVKSDDAAQAA